MDISRILSMRSTSLLARISVTKVFNESNPQLVNMLFMMSIDDLLFFASRFIRSPLLLIFLLSSLNLEVLYTWNWDEIGNFSMSTISISICFIPKLHLRWWGCLYANIPSKIGGENSLLPAVQYQCPKSKKCRIQVSHRTLLEDTL